MPFSIERIPTDNSVLVTMTSWISGARGLLGKNVANSLFTFFNCNYWLSFFVLVWSAKKFFFFLTSVANLNFSCCGLALLWYEHFKGRDTFWNSCRCWSGQRSASSCSCCPAGVNKGLFYPVTQLHRYLFKHKWFPPFVCTRLFFPFFHIYPSIYLCLSIYRCIYRSTDFL